ncbi:MAG: hypothetical protein BZ136_06305 [Methanosphaera sp. rholeuAM74]|nr:MAG: hypothetical protein BZ136_06305 [Methanosphaera sp. rholeuAM74]
MSLIAVNHLMFIIEFAILLHIGILLLLNFIPLNHNAVFVLSLLIGGAITLVFAFDALCLVVSILSHHEFTHPFGPIAILAVVTSWAIMPILERQDVRTSSIRLLLYIITVGITIFGAVVHRDFLIMWVLGLVIGFFIIAKSHNKPSMVSLRTIGFIIFGLFVVFGAMEVISQIAHMQIISPLSRIDRMNLNQFSSLQLVIDNTNLWGHNVNATYWGNSSIGNSDGYISLPLTWITTLGLPYPLFYGILVTKKDVIDYFLPGIFGIGFDFGYVALALIIIWILIVIIVGFKVLDKYRLQRERGNGKYLGREALLTGSLSAFIAQTILGLFIITRTMNGSAMVSYLFLSALIMANIVTTKR